MRAAVVGEALVAEFAAVFAIQRVDCEVGGGEEECSGLDWGAGEDAAT